MWTNSVHCMKCSPDVKDGHDTPFRNEFLGSSRGTICFISDEYPRHKWETSTRVGQRTFLQKKILTPERY